MIRTIPQQQRYSALCDQFTAVAILDLDDGHMSLIGRTVTGLAEAALVVNGAGVPLDDRAALERLIAQRAASQRAETQATDHLRAALEVMRRNGVQLNIAELSRDTGLPRSTIYDWLPPDPTPAAGAATDGA